jgi:tripartite motif-containing protein 71
VAKVGPPSALRLEKVLDRSTLEAIGISRPSRLAFDPSGNLYVLDPVRRRVAKLDGSGAPLFELGGYGEDPSSFSIPLDFAIDRRQSLLVLDRGKSAIVAFDGQGHFLAVRAVGTDVAADAFDPSARLLIDPFGDLWLLAARERDLVPLDDRLERARSARTLAPEESLGTLGAAAFLPEGGGWIYDQGGRRLRRFGAGGRLLGAVAWPESSSAPPTCDLATDPGGFLYVADPAGQQLLVHDPSGALKLARALGGPGAPWHPAAIAVSRFDRVAIADPARGEIQILAIEREGSP